MAEINRLNRGAHIADRRNDFPALATSVNGKPLAFLDTASSAQKPVQVINRMRGVMETHYANVHRGLYKFSQQTTSAYEDVRGKVARFINARSENEIVFTRNTTESINLIAASWGRTNLKEGDEIILTGMEHHANIVPWQMVAKQTGAVIRVVPVLNDGSLDLDAYKNLLSTRTKLVAFCHISNSLGTVNPAAQMVEMAKGENPEIIVLIDGSQSVVHASFDVRSTGCDFFVFTGHKLYGPTGVGVLYGREDLLNAMPPYQGGGDMIDRVSFTGTSYKNAPSRFEAGTPAIVEVIGLGEAIDYITDIGYEAITAHEASLSAYMHDELSHIDGLNFIGTAAGKAGILSFTADWAHITDIAMILDRNGVAVRTGHHCCMPLMERFGIDGTIRASLGLYSNKADIDALVVGLEKAKDMFS